MTLGHLDGWVEPNLGFPIRMVDMDMWSSFSREKM